MEGYSELHLLVRALRDRVIDPRRLAEAVGDWNARSSPSLMSFLSGRGVISPDDLHRLESESTDRPAGTPRDELSLQPTQDLDATRDETIDMRGAGRAPNPLDPADRY